MSLQRLTTLALVIAGLAACDSGAGSMAGTQPADDFETRFFAAGPAINPCFKERENISGFWLSLEAKRPGVKTVFDKGNPRAVNASGQEIPLMSVIPLNADMVDSDRMGTANFCGGSGGVRIEGNDKEWGSVSQMNISFPYPNEETENQVTFSFGAFGTMWLLLFFDAPFDSIEEIHLSNGEVIKKSEWLKSP